MLYPTLRMAFAALLATGAGAVRAADTGAAATPVVLELFTSQSCSSCPPADALLAQLADRPEIIALGCHVTYWNHLSWRDTVSREVCTERQRGYAGANRRSRIFTPELVVNGVVSVLGSDRDAIELAIRDASPVAAVGLTRPDPRTLAIDLPPLGRVAAEIWLVAYGPDALKAIGRGENRGRRVNYVNPVVSARAVPAAAATDGTGLRVTLDDGERDAAGLVVLVHDGPEGSGRIVAAGRLRAEAVGMRAASSTRS